MLGHKLWQRFKDRFDTWITLRGDFARVAAYGLFLPPRVVFGVDAFHFDTVIQAFGQVKPEVAINCIGIVKQVPLGKDPVASLEINSLFPHRLAGLCGDSRVRLIHMSTDCVFSGRRGGYTEQDVPDAEDLYGRSKLMGEIQGPGCLTLRTSMVGRELGTQNGLLEWFFNNRNRKVQGYTEAYFSGFTTLKLAEIIAQVMEKHPELQGIYHLASQPISKYELLCLVRDVFEHPVEIEPCSEVRVNRTLDGRHYREVTGFTSPSWEDMIRELKMDPTPYETWRNKNAF
jgi:dTDP-4-dehydrorhamnose reductase